jgi:hypothetical protein
MDTSGMGLAPPFTRENAAENARKAVISREKNRLNRNLASNPSYAMTRAAKQVEKVLSWMDRETDRDEFGKLAAMLDRLWNKAFPTQGAAKPRGNRDRSPTPQPVAESTELANDSEPIGPT